MTQLLISVKNVTEALLALESGVDIIDLKDPDIGALAALDLVVTQQILNLIEKRAVVSATVGESHASIDLLVTDIKSRAELGVDIVKIAVSELFYNDYFHNKFNQLSNSGIKLVAVFFAEDKLDLSLLAALERAGFYGAMLDTRTKQKNLLKLQSKRDLQSFTLACNQYHLESGLAGSLQAQHVVGLLEFGSTYMGFRGGACENSQRNLALSGDKILEIKNMLRPHNKLKGKAQKILSLALHS